MSEQKKFILRFGVAQRIEHLALVISFTTLGLTGLIQKFIGADISLFLIRALGGIETVRIIHRVAAIIFAVEVLYHILLLGYLSFVKRSELTMAPGVKDIRDGLQSVGYNLGISKTRPKMGRYSFDEKLEYWAMIWGGLVMGITGFILWNPIISTRFLPGVIIPASKAAHGAEAVLAVLAILLWHFYHVHIKRWNNSMINGKLSREEMEEDHPIELEKREIQSATVIDAKILQKRKMIYYPVAIVVTILGFIGIYLWLTTEVTSITTLPPAERIAVVSTRVPTSTPTLEPTSTPTATPIPAPTALPEPTSSGDVAPVLPTELPVFAESWKSSIGAIITGQCGMCHGQSGGLSLDSYTSAMAGGKSGPGFTPGDLTKSSIYQIQLAGNHPGQFSPSDLEIIKLWIEAGASEN